MNVQKIKGRMTELGISGTEMARKLGIDPATYYRRMKKNGDNFMVMDLMVFKRELNLDAKEALDFLLDINSH